MSAELVVMPRAWCRWLLWCTLSLMPMMASAAAAAAAAEAEAEAAEALSWLSRIHQAAAKTNFKGTFVVSGGGLVSSARIVHFVQGSDQYEHIEALDGQARHVYRHNEWVHTVWPQTQRVQVEQRDPQGSFPALLRLFEPRLAEFYEIKRRVDERVAGHDTDVWVLQPRDAYRFGYRLWADKRSGLLLRADVWAEPHHVLETAVFSEITIGLKPEPASIEHSMKRLEGYRVARQTLMPTQLEAEGWSLNQASPGFKRVSCVKRPLAAGAPADREVIQAVFSDGVTYVSVFIEPFDPRLHLQPMQTVTGATHTLARRHGEFWATVVGDVPVVTLRAFQDGLGRVKK